MLAIAMLFLGILFKGWLPGSEIVRDGSRVELFRSYISGCILLGIAPCTAMVLIWGHLARGNDGHTLVMVAINSLTMLFLYAPLGGWLLGVNRMPIPWQTIVLSVLIYVGLPLLCGYYSRKWIIALKGFKWFEETFIHYLTPVSIGALLFTLVLLFSFKGQLIIDHPQTIFLIAVPLLIQTCLIFVLAYALAKWFKLRYIGHSLRHLLGSCPGDRGGSADRGPRHADARKVLFKNTGLVRSTQRFLNSVCLLAGGNRQRLLLSKRSFTKYERYNLFGISFGISDSQSLIHR
jgi:arsenical-resistance protein